jgi:hypothetical protein
MAKSDNRKNAAGPNGVAGTEKVEASNGVEARNNPLANFTHSWLKGQKVEEDEMRVSFDVAPHQAAAIFTYDDQDKFIRVLDVTGKVVVAIEMTHQEQWYELIQVSNMLQHAQHNMNYCYSCFRGSISVLSDRAEIFEECGGEERQYVA